MKAKTPQKLEMGARAFIFSRVHPDPSPGYLAALARLEDCLTRATDLEAQQLNGLLEVHAAAIRKRELRRTLRRAHLAHLRRVARIAERDLLELHQKFVLRRGTIPYRTFQSTARYMAAEAERWKEIMVKHGLADTLLQSLARSLDEFDQAVQRGIEGHRAHVGASAGLDEVADEVVLIVQALDALNRFRFANVPGQLAEWASLSNIVSTPLSAAAKLVSEGGTGSEMSAA